MNLQPQNSSLRTIPSCVKDTNVIPLATTTGLDFLSFGLFSPTFEQKCAFFGTSKCFEKFIRKSRADFKLHLGVRSHLRKKWTIDISRFRILRFRYFATSIYLLLLIVCDSMFLLFDILSGTRRCHRLETTGTAERSTINASSA